ncbi:MAG: cytochrome C oxidase subunit III [Proteobacteria bacterium]|nr:MAG: cytochrome C oxidase subunit III [Pseudomonadota bacterium]
MNHDLDVSALPTYGYGSRAVTWWGTMGMVAIEGTVFLAAIAAYFYLRLRVDAWPPTGSAPSLLWGSLAFVVFAVSAWPNHWTKRRSEREDLRGSRVGLWICVAFGLALLLVRIAEYGALNTTYTDSAYGSIVFALLTLHTVHLLTDFIDTVVLAVLVQRGPLESRRFVDVSENCLYWWFVVLTWIPIYLTIYIAPRVL